VLLLPLIAAERPDAYAGAARRWLTRWLQEAEPGLEDVADAAALLAEMPVYGDALANLRSVARL
jgi:hypothetical protein